MMLAEPFAEALQPCGQRRLVGRWLVAIIVSTRLGHVRTHLAFETSLAETSLAETSCNLHDASQHHAFDVADAVSDPSSASSKIAADPPPPEAARTILSGFGQVKNRHIFVKLLK